MKTRQYWIDLHKKNVTWANDQIRICLMARRVLKGIEQSKFSMLLHHANEHSDAELLPLKQAIAKYQDGWNLRFQNYSLGLLSEIFDVKTFIYEARTLKWKEQEKPWLAGTPA